MKKSIPIIVISVILIISSFFIGSHVNENKNIKKRMNTCVTLISFAIDKVEHEDISSQDTMEALISNIYAAYMYCDNLGLSTQLHDIWNTLIFRSDEYIARKDVLVERLENISEALMTGE